MNSVNKYGDVPTYIAITSVPYCMDLDIYCEHNIPGQNAKKKTENTQTMPNTEAPAKVSCNIEVKHINRVLYPLMNNLNKG
jgi:hypothetical protein